MTLDTLLRRAAERLLAAGSPSPRLDAEVLWMHVSGRDRTWLYTWGDRGWGDRTGADRNREEAPCERFQLARFDALIAARVQGMPVAYLTGEREFFGLRLATSRETLIPRPDTETLVAAALERAGTSTGQLLDMGTGTGAVALAFASERPGWQVRGVDVRPEAVALARRNAASLELNNADFIHSDWFAALVDDPAEGFELIVANPPYIAESDPHLSLGDVRFEPRSALVADDDGHADLHYLIDHAGTFLAAGGWLLLEHGHTQAAGVRGMLDRAGYTQVASVCDLGGHERVSLGRWPAG